MIWRTYNSYLFRHPTRTGRPVYFDLLLKQDSLVHGGQGCCGRRVLLELHKAVGIIARFSDDLATFHRADLTEDSQYEVLGDVIVQVTNIQSLRSPALISPSTHFRF